ncbi:LysR family transcriptional regulator [Edaphosphingomonas haloaromaticamans]|uniref:HTH-type transcriptional regulator DmlR n=1 Tax=Edaphosphingomonas haloaromaticamans TaxID=653954 RepID=A0A1S1HJD4_9SPHN|nr:LysR family transcriptional regulator [Sphingomonas haloaromaticamans]OHT20640.1 HTH-type transcriptional regulator DmlR [Sphingomonas haloaromaticamans]
MRSSWDGIEEFLAVYDRGSFSAAADGLRVSPSHISRAVSQLEDRLRVRLFLRTTRTVTPTDTAHAFAERCRRMIADREDALAAIDGEGPPQGTLRITCSIAFGELYIAPLLRRFVELHPYVSAELDLNNRILDLIAENYDLAIRTGHLADSRLIGTRIATRQLHVCASPDYLERHGAPQTVSDLNGHACIPGTAEFWHFLVKGRMVEFRPTGRWRCNSGFAVCDAAVAGMGICQLPDFYVREHVSTGALVPLLQADAVPEEPVWAVYPHRVHLQSRVRHFIDMLHAELSAATAVPGSKSRILTGAS